MRVTVCQLSDSREEFELGWEALCKHVRSQRSQLVLLPEMPFATWFAAVGNFEAKVWNEAVAEHRRWKARLMELTPAVVIGTEPAGKHKHRRNEAYAWRGGRTKALHRKRYLPNEDGFWEANWYEPS